MTPERFRPTITAFLAHPDAGVRAGLADELAADGITVVGECGDGAEAVAEVARVVPDVAVLAVDLPGTAGAEACRQLRVDLPVVRVLLVADADGEDALAGLEAGAYGCWLRSAPQTPFAKAVRGTMRRESLPTPWWARAILDRYDELAGDAERVVPAPSLTPTEHEVLERIAGGATVADIAADNEVTTHLVRLHAGYAIIKLYRALADERQLQALRA